MDYASRDLYRSVIAELASHSAMDEVEVAQAAVSLARKRRNRRGLERESHIGYYLVDDGLPDLRRRIRYRAPLGRASLITFEISERVLSDRHRNFHVLNRGVVTRRTRPSCRYRCQLSSFCC